MEKLDADKAQKNENQEQAKEHLVNSLVGGAIVIGAVVVLVYLFRFGGYSISKEPADWGALGDYFGGVLNPIFAFFAFVILVVSLKVQTKELKATTDEMRNANNAQERLLQQQNHANQLQNFENLFFQLLQLKAQAFEKISLNTAIYNKKSIEDLIDAKNGLNRCFASMNNIIEKIESRKSTLANFEPWLKEYFLIPTDDKEKKIQYAVSLAGRTQDGSSNAIQNQLRDILLEFSKQEKGGLYEKVNVSPSSHLIIELVIKATYEVGILEVLEKLFNDYVSYHNEKIFALKKWYADLERTVQEIGLQENDWESLKYLSHKDKLNNICQSNKQNIEKHLEIFKNYFYGSWSVYIREVGYQYFANYFRICYQILNLIDTHEAFQYEKNQVEDEPNDLQKRYAKIFRADLNESELQALLLNGTGIWGKKKFKPLLEKYKMFAQLDCNSENNGELQNRTHIFDFAFHYDEKAFGNNENWQSYFELKKQDENKWRSKFKINQYGVDKYLKKLPEEKV